MKHAVTIIFSLLLVLGDGVFARSVPASASPSGDHACGMSEKKPCARCACCVAPADSRSTPVRESSPAPSGNERLQIPASALTVLYELSPDSPSPARSALNAPSSSQPVPLFLRHCLLLI